MVSFFFQSAFLYGVILFQISFLNVVFSNVFPNAVLAVIIALTVTRGFFSAWPWAVFSGIIFDILSMGVVGVTSMVLIMFSYSISFVSRRFLVEHRASGMGLAVFCTALFSMLYTPLVLVVQHVFIGTSLSVVDLAIRHFFTHFVLNAILNGVLFMILYGTVLRINHALDFYGDQVVVRR